jgi:hypothetical protein
MDKEIPKISQLSKDKTSARVKSAKKAAARSTMNSNPKMLAKTRDISAKAPLPVEGDAKIAKSKKLDQKMDLDVLLLVFV